MKIESCLSWKQVEDELVEAVRLSWRLPGGGGSSWASDGPWFLMTAKARAAAAVADRMGDYAQHEAARQEIEVQAVKDMRNSPRTSPLTAREVDWMNVRLGWLEMVSERDRRLVAVTLSHKASATGHISWRRIRATLNKNRHWREVAIGDRGLGARYSRAIAGLAQALNARGSGVAA